MNESAVKSINIEPSFEDIEKTTEVLAHLQPGKLPLKIFIEIANGKIDIKLHAVRVYSRDK